MVIRLVPGLVPYILADLASVLGDLYGLVEQLGLYTLLTVVTVTQ